MKGYLFFDDKTYLAGEFFGYPKKIEGEVVFSTGMVGYPESLTDPSYKDQILVLTYPLIGNYGIPKIKYLDHLVQNFESEKVQISGLVVTNLTSSAFHWQAQLNLDDWLKIHHVPGLMGLDTRFITQKLRQTGTRLGKILPHRPSSSDYKFENISNLNLLAKVSCTKPIIHNGGKKRILLFDCGVKAGIIRNLLKKQVTVIQVPWDCDPFGENIKFDGVVISNGPGDPMKADKTISVVKRMLKKNIPILGICLGNQILALAAGGKTYKLQYGHRSLNQPCLLVGSHKAYITSQNHGFAVRMSSLSADWKEWFVNLNDGTNEGIIHKRKPFASVQFHPEVSPGPNDTGFVFEKFLEWINK